MGIAISVCCKCVNFSTEEIFLRKVKTEYFGYDLKLKQLYLKTLMDLLPVKRFLRKTSNLAKNGLNEDDRNFSASSPILKQNR